MEKHALGCLYMRSLLSFGARLYHSHTDEINNRTLFPARIRRSILNDRKLISVKKQKYDLIFNGYIKVDSILGKHFSFQL